MIRVYEDTLSISTRRKRSARLLEDPIVATLTRLTGPMVIGSLALAAFNLTDTWFVSRLGTVPLAAMSFTFPVVLLVNSMALGLGVGTAAVISRTIGSGDHERVRRLTSDALVLGVLVAGVLVTIGLLTMDPVFRLMGAEGEVLVLVKRYMSIWYPGMLFVVIPMVGNSAIRATGDTLTPGLVMVTAFLVNVVLDPVLIFGLGPFPRMELAGAALATVIARAVTLGVALWVLGRREKMLTSTSPKDLREVIRSWGELLYVGLPTAGTNVILPLAAGVITGMVARFGPHAVAALGVGTRVDQLAMTLIIALSSVLGPFVGQNLGAGRIDRVRAGVRSAQRFALIWGAGVFVVLQVGARPLAGLFSQEPEVVRLAALYLHLVPLGYGLFGVLQLSNMTFNVIHRPFNAAGLVILQTFLLAVPLAALGATLLGPPGVFGALPVANLTAGTLAFLWLRRVLARPDRLLPSADHGVTVEDSAKTAAGDMV